MPSRYLTALAIATLIVVIVNWVVVGKRYAAVEWKKQEGGLVFPQLEKSVSAVSQIQIAHGGEVFSISRDLGGWKNLGLGGYPVDKARVQQFVLAVASLKYLEPKTARQSLYPILEVEDVAAGTHSTRVTLKDASATVLADLIVGKSKPSGSAGPRLYLRLNGDERAWLAEGSLNIRHGALGWINRELINVSPDTISTLQFVHADGERIELRRRDNADLTLANLPAGAELRHPYQISFLASVLEDVRFNDIQPFDAKQKNDEAAYQMEVTTKDSLLLTLSADEPANDGTTWVQISARISDEQQTSDKLQQEVIRINSAYGGWSLKLPSKFSKRLKIRLSDITGTPKTNNEATQ